jgi:hypothetical protein
MTREVSGGGLRRWIADFAVAFALFWGVVLAVGFAHTHAHALPLPSFARQTVAPGTVAVQAGLLARESDHPFEAWRSVQARPERALLLFSVAFAVLAAFNLAILRHLRRVYASPRRSGWRRG